MKPKDIDEKIFWPFLFLLILAIISLIIEIIIIVKIIFFGLPFLPSSIISVVAWIFFWVSVEGLHWFNVKRNLNRKEGD